MGQQKRLAQFGIVVVLTVIFQLVLIAVDLRQTPVRTAEEFVRNYYYMDPAMGEQMCTALSANGEAVADYLYSVTENAAQRGFSIKFVRRMFTELHVETISNDGAAAKVHVSGETRTAINPVYMVIGKLFHLGEYHPVDLTLDLIKDKGQWRVCGGVPGFDS